LPEALEDAIVGGSSLTEINVPFLFNVEGTVTYQNSLTADLILQSSLSGDLIIQSSLDAASIDWTITSAINAIPEEKYILGQKLTFNVNTMAVWETYQFVGLDLSTATYQSAANWVKLYSTNP